MLSIDISALLHIYIPVIPWLVAANALWATVQSGLMVLQQRGLIVDFLSCSMFIYHDKVMMQRASSHNCSTQGSAEPRFKFEIFSIHQPAGAHSSHVCIWPVRSCSATRGVPPCLVFWLHLLSPICLSVTSITSLVLFYRHLCRAVSPLPLST